MLKFLSALLLVCALTTYAAAQAVLPCGDVVAATYTIKWQLPVESPEADEFILLRLPVGGAGESLPLQGVTLVDGVYQATVPGFQNDTGYALSLVARNAQGDSTPSNTLTLPATIRGACPSGPPAQPRILEIFAAIGALLDEAKELLAGSAAQ